MSTGQTWQSREEMRRGIALMLQGTPYFAWQLPDGSYRPCRHVEQLTRFEQNIFDGQNTPGFYTIRPDNQTRWGALDFDAHGPAGSTRWRNMAESAFDILKGRFPETWFLESSPGGFHVVSFADALLPAADMRRVLLEIAPPRVEIFPKQDALDATKPNAKGSLLRFPGYHQRKGTWARFLARSGRVQDVEGIAPTTKPAAWQEPTPEGRLRSLYAVATRGIELTGPGQRFHVMQRIAGRLKGRATESEALWVYSAWHNRHADKIGTPLAESRKGFFAWFNRAKPCNASVPQYPRTEAEQAILDNLPKFPDVKAEHLAAVVGLLLDAERHAKAQGLATFWRSCRDLAGSIGTSESTAKRVRSAAAKALTLKVARAGSTGYATEFEVRP